MTKVFPRKTHAQEYAEQQQKKAAKAARLAEEKARKAEEAQLAREAEENRKKRKSEKELRHLKYAHEEYKARWQALGIGIGVATELNVRSEPPVEVEFELTFDDIPWPIANAHRPKAAKGGDGRRIRPSVTVDELTTEAVAAFLLYTPDQERVVEVERKKERRERLREAILRFHPDKFEGRFMRRVKQTDQERVREAIGQVSRVLNSLMGG